MSEPEHQSFEEMMAHIEFMRAEQERLNNAMVEDDKTIAEIEAMLKAAKAKKGEKSSKRWDLHQAIKKENEALEALKRRLALEEAERRALALANARRVSLDELTETAGWRGRALPHQLDGAHYLSAAQRAICADGMGVGKTLQAVMVIDFLEAMQDGGKKILVICPGEVIAGFENEFERWANERIVVKLAGLGTKEVLETLSEFGDLMPDRVDLINYEILARSKEVVTALVMEQYDTVICDEAHRMKETSKNTYKAVEQIVLSHNSCPICGTYSFPTHPSEQSHGLTEAYRTVMCPKHKFVQGVRSVKNMFPMTGTLILNRPDEAFASLHLVNDAAFPRLNDFYMDYCEKGWDNKWKWSHGGESRLVNKIQGMYIRRTRLDAGIVLPPQDIKIHEIEIDEVSYPLQTKILRDLAKFSQIEIDEGRAATFFSILPLITRQRQAAVWPGGIWMTFTDRFTGQESREHIGQHYLESAKLDKAVELYKEFVDAGERVVFFSQFKEPLIELKARLGDDVVEFHGDTPKSIRDEVKRNFDRSYNETPKWNGVLAHYRLGGEGLNLTAATQVIILDEQWNPGMNSQAYDRVNRLGQTQETCVHILRLKNSIDTWMAELIKQKAKIVDGFETEISFAQLADLFRSKD